MYLLIRNLLKKIAFESSIGIIIPFGQSMEYNKIFYFRNHAENEARRLVPDLFSYSKKALYKEVKGNGLQIGFTTCR